MNERERLNLELNSYVYVPKKGFVCKVCGHTLKTEHGIWVHIKKHMPFLCEVFKGGRK